MLSEEAAQVRDFLGMLDALGADDLYVDVPYRTKHDHGATQVTPLARGFPKTPGVIDEQYDAYQDA
jgi:hypothetical protein